MTGSDQKKRWLDRVLSVAALLVSVLAAAFAAGQAWIAWDQEHRALRAYVLLNATLKKSSDNPEQPYRVTIVAENMGVTPAFSLHLEPTWRFILARADFYAERAERDKAVADGLAQSCTGVNFSASTANSFAHTFSESVASAPLPQAERDELDAKGGSLIVSGVACYRDIFQKTHKIPYCYEWLLPNTGTNSCAAFTVPPTPAGG